ncbi:uncharacterized protein DNG_08313 [Cephalotrichum gorgonifer]|uniref:INO80 complex subunit B-like conserved region domain-containing protein n=1 Tax=Cephalotrichum gorgonifer TaxID=2041049 RepID=A0AAE8SY84_9PEZI|nr:uncharacterized protein DNG_08313 [Cephalotrichum gorgonifer]
MADSDRNMSSRDRRSRGSGVSRDPPSSPTGDHLNLNIKVSSNKLRQATVGRDGVRTEQQISVSNGQSSPAGRRSRGGRKNYVVESDSDELEEEDDDEEADVGEDDDEDDEDADADADGDEDADGDGEIDEMELDADGEADDDAVGQDGDADGDVDMDAEDSTITVSRPKGGARAKQLSTSNLAQRTLYEEDDDDDELSDPGPSDIEETITYGVSAGGDEDAEGEEEIEVAGEEEEEEEEEEDDEELDSDGQPTGADTPDLDLTKMTRRQRARFEDKPQEYMKLSDEVQAKKVFTAEELSMRRSEMARRRRNLSDKRNEEVKMETINKLLKKQAPKTNKRAAADDDEADQGPDPTIFRWVNDRDGSRVLLPDELLASRAGNVFGPPSKMGKMVEEVQ